MALLSPNSEGRMMLNESLSIDEPPPEMLSAHRHSLPPPAPSARRYSFHQALEEKKKNSGAGLPDTASPSLHRASPLLTTDGVPAEYAVVRRKSEFGPLAHLPLGSKDLSAHLQALADAAKKSPVDSSPETPTEVSNNRRSFRVRRGGDESDLVVDRSWLPKDGDSKTSPRQPSPNRNVLPSSLALFGAGQTQTILVMGAPQCGKSSVIEALRFQERFEEKNAEKRNTRNYIEIHSDQDDLWRTLSGVVGILVVFLSDKEKSLRAAQETLQILHASSVTSPLILVATKCEAKSKSVVAAAEKLTRRMGGVELVEISARLHTNVAALSAAVRQMSAEDAALSPPSPHSPLTPKSPKSPKEKLSACASVDGGGPSSPGGRSALASLLLPNTAACINLAKSCDNIPIASK